MIGTPTSPRTRVEVYRNLTKDCLSVRDCKTGRVIAHTQRIELEDVRFVVQKGGRARVLRERTKNVHAFVRGFITCSVGEHTPPPAQRRLAKYNPYAAATFTDAETGEPVADARRAVVTPRGAEFWGAA